MLSFLFIMTVVVPLSAFLTTISVLDLGSLSAIRSLKISKKEREIRNSKWIEEFLLFAL